MGQRVSIFAWWVGPAHAVEGTRAHVVLRPQSPGDAPDNVGVTTTSSACYRGHGPRPRRAVRPTTASEPRRGA